MDKEVQANKPIEIFYSYSHKDKDFLDELIKYLALMRREGLIANWHDREISPGQEWKGEIDEKINSADVILLLVSVDFIDSDYCYDIEMKRAIERHKSRAATVIPIIIRECDWMSAPFGVLQALPEGAKPVASWSKPEQAFTNISKGIRRVVSQLISRRSHPTVSEAGPEDERLKKSLDAAAERGDYLSWLKLTDHLAEWYGHRREGEAIRLWERGVEISEELKTIDPSTSARMRAVSFWRLAASCQRRGDSRTVPLLKMALGLESGVSSPESLKSFERLSDFALTLRSLMPQFSRPFASWLYEVEASLYEKAISLLTLEHSAALMFLANLIRFYQINGADVNAVQVKLQQAIDVAEKNIAAQEPGSIELLVGASTWLENFGKRVDSGKLKDVLEQIILDHENKYADSEETAHFLYLLSKICGDKNRAESLLERALLIAEKCQAGNSLIPKILLQLGTVLRDLAQLDTAISYLEKALSQVNENNSDQAHLFRQIKAQLILIGLNRRDADL